MKKLFVLMAVVTVSLVMAASAVAGSVTLAWDQVTGASGYRIHYGTATKVYTTKVDVKNVTTYTLSLPAGTYYFAATAYSSTGSESDYSNEVSTIFPAAPTNLKVVITITP